MGKLSGSEDWLVTISRLQNQSSDPRTREMYDFTMGQRTALDVPPDSESKC